MYELDNGIYVLYCSENIITFLIFRDFYVSLSHIDMLSLLQKMIKSIPVSDQLEKY